MNEPKEYKVVQNWLIKTKAKFHGLREARRKLEHLLGQHAKKIRWLPDRRSQDPSNHGTSKPGDKISPTKCVDFIGRCTWRCCTELSYTLIYLGRARYTQFAGLLDDRAEVRRFLGLQIPFFCRKGR
jgi:hypothetical protein